jgi:Lar family restriction alleviation protein
MAETTRDKAGSERTHRHDPVSGRILRPCPFCGSADVCLIYGIDEPAFVMCNECRAFGPWARTATEATEHWNGRPDAIGS